MISPFAFFFCSVFNPVLHWLESYPASGWLTYFFPPHGDHGNFRWLHGARTSRGSAHKYRRLPSFLILVGMAPWFDRLQSFPWFIKVPGDIICSFVGLLYTVAIRFALRVDWGWPHLILALVAFSALYIKLDILWVVLGGTAISAFAF